MAKDATNTRNIGQIKDCDVTTGGMKDTAGAELLLGWLRLILV